MSSKSSAGEPRKKTSRKTIATRVVCIVLAALMVASAAYILIDILLR